MFYFISNSTLCLFFTILTLNYPTMSDSEVMQPWHIIDMSTLMEVTLAIVVLCGTRMQNDMQL